MNLEDFNKNPWSAYQTYGRPDNVIIPETSQSLYLLNLNTLEQIELKLLPNELAESYKQRMIDISTYGLSSPMHFYTGGEGKILTFSFQLIEDENNKDGSIYKLIRELEKLSEAVNSEDNDQFKPPYVYLQIGEQFAGRGFINSTFSYSGTYRDGRYTLIDISMVFTFIEEYTTVHNLDDNYSDYTPSDIYKKYLGNSSGMIGDEAIKDFIDDLIELDLMTKQVYSNVKLQNLLSIIYVDMNAPDLEKQISKNKHTAIAVTIARHYEDFALITGTPGLTTNAYINNLDVLRTKVDRDYRSAISMSISIEQKEAIEQAVNELIRLINLQQTMYSITGGAGR